MTKRVYLIQATVKAEDGGYIPCIAEENKAGYWLTDWNWGDNLELAEKCALEKNAKILGMPMDTPEQIKELEKIVMLVIFSSMAQGAP